MINSHDPSLAAAAMALGVIDVAAAMCCVGDNGIAPSRGVQCREAAE